MLSPSLSTPISALAIILSILCILHSVHSTTACCAGQMGTLTRKGASPHFVAQESSPGEWFWYYCYAINIRQTTSLTFTKRFVWSLWLANNNNILSLGLCEWNAFIEQSKTKPFCSRIYIKNIVQKDLRKQNTILSILEPYSKASISNKQPSQNYPRCSQSSSSSSCWRPSLPRHRFSR